MADVNSPLRGSGSPRPASSVALELPRVDDSRLVAMVELLFFAYRDFVAGPDEILAELGFGRAHHRILHFVDQNPGLRVADLLGILKITKQSLARVLKQLVDEGYILQETGANDRRERRLHLTDKGRCLAQRLLALQTRLLGDALAMAGHGSVRAAAAFLAGVMSAEDHERAETLVRCATAAVPRSGASGASGGDQGV
ncbi:MAG: MarR family winged helix-turn-helix transcriptional regulator [Hyphomicrobiaceae bacterium]